MPETLSSTDYTTQITESFALLRAAILDKDEATLWNLHDPLFKATELHGRIMTAPEHIAAILNGGELAMEFSDLTVIGLGELALAWGRQSLRGQLRPEDITEQISSQVTDGIVFVLTAVWRWTGGRWRILTYHVSLPVA